MLSDLTRRTAIVAFLGLAWTLEAGAATPTISGSPDTMAVTSSQYRFQPTAYDADRQRLTFSISNKPQWASFNRNTGLLSGTPRSTGTHSNIVIRVSDGRNTAKLPAFRITVTSNDGAPTISGTPVRTANVGAPYAFQPSASDPDRGPQPLAFAIDNKPAWASFDGTSGTLYGTPTEARTHSGVVISVSDGRTSTKLPAFDIEVRGGGTYSATVQWQAPTYNTDGTPITDLAGYRVSYGMSPGNYTTTLNVTGAMTTSAVVEGLGAGSYYFVVQAVTTAGSVSDFSNEVSRYF